MPSHLRYGSNGSDMAALAFDRGKRRHGKGPSIIACRRFCDNAIAAGNARGPWQFALLKSSWQALAGRCGPAIGRTRVLLGETLIEDTFAEAFGMRFTRLIVTAADEYWLEACLRE